jgi:hypothetical protein
VPVVKQCLFCGRYFTPDHRVRERQKACSGPECKKKRKKTAQDAWVQKNPGYFAGRYPYVKAWRQKKTVIQDEMPLIKRPQKIIFLMPDDTIQMIQDKILLRRSGKRTFTAHGYG